jgi:hypothetical protein
LNKIALLSEKTPIYFFESDELFNVKGEGKYQINNSPGKKICSIARREDGGGKMKN